MSRRLTNLEFIEKAEYVHGKKYDYSKINYTRSHDKVEIICFKHGSFWQIANDHLNGNGCSLCSGHNVSETSLELFINRSKAIHGDIYSYSDVNYVNATTKVDIICKKHGKFSQVPYSHWRGSGCPKCKVLKLRHDRTKTTQQFIEDAVKVHGNIYDYSKTEYTGASKKVSIICPKHGEFFKSPIGHVANKQGCPKCRASTGELIIMRWLEENKINYIPQKSFSDCRNPKTNYPLKYDFFIPDLNILIEYDGKQHFERSCFSKHFKTQKELEETQFRDKVKTQYSEKNGFKLIRIPFKEKPNIKTILLSKIL